MVKILKLLDIKIELAKSSCKLGLLTRKVFFTFIIFDFGGSQFPSFSIINFPFAKRRQLNFFH